VRRAVLIVCCIAAWVGAASSRSRADTPDPTRPNAAWPQAGVPLRAMLPPAESGGPGRWFYTGLPYGSEALVHPLRLVFNGGFGTLQFENRSNRIGDVDFRHGWTQVWTEVGSPLHTIGLNGWDDFLRAEVIPLKLSRKSGQYWPNYTLHLIGGGMSAVMMREWYEQHGFAHASLAAGATMTTYHLLNEVVEAENRLEPSTDAIADLLLFDPAGIWLFSHEGVDGFFSRRLHLRDWSSQPAIDPATGAVENNGQNFSMKFALPRSDHWSLFYYFGNHGEAGLSYRFSNGSALSAGGGFRAGRLIGLGNGSQTVDLLPSAGLFYDRNGSLLFSVTTAKTSRDGLRVNAYPGLLHVAGWSPGLFVLQSRGGKTVVGMHIVQLPVGLAGRP